MAARLRWRPDGRGVGPRQDGRWLMGDGVERRLASYGTLAPGRPNHHQLEGLTGRWPAGPGRGRLVDSGWGAELGFPALVLEPDGDAVGVDVFESDDLPAHWERLDQFEGA